MNFLLPFSFALLLFCSFVCTSDCPYFSSDTPFQLFNDETCEIGDIVEDWSVIGRVAPDRRTIRSGLLQRYQQSDPAFLRKVCINYAEVEPINWPSSVIFYSASDWTTLNLQALEAAMPEISFKRDWRQFPTCSEEQKQSIHARLKQVALEFTSSRKLPWSLVFKRKFPTLHLSSVTSAKWNGKDIFKIRIMLAYYENDTEEAERLKLEERKINLNATLRKNYSAAVEVISFRIDWSAVQVIGWPMSVLFFSSQDWSEADVDALEAAVENISFIPTQSETLPVKECNLLFIKFLNSFGGVDSMFDWSAVRLAHPGVHFTCSDPSNWKPHDYVQVKQILSVQEILSDVEFIAEIERALLLPEATKESIKRKIEEI